ncbi:MAG: hypothetical protein AAFR84_14260 [Pseudomonadota bacterium]
MITLSLELDSSDREFRLSRGVVIHYRPVTYPEYLLAKAASQSHIRAVLERLRAAGTIGEDADPLGVADAMAQVVAEAEAVLAEKLVLTATLRWEGIADQDGNPLPVTAAAWRAIANHFLGEADAYALAVQEPQTRVDAEGNGSTPAQNGAGAAGTTPAPDAKKAPLPAP